MLTLCIVCLHIYIHVVVDTADVDAPNEEELTHNECEEQIPHLDDILKASFASVGVVLPAPMHQEVLPFLWKYKYRYANF